MDSNHNFFITGQDKQDFHNISLPRFPDETVEDYPPFGEGSDQHSSIMPQS
jgi:hypothetical protein